jgi:predicted PurR-regulated permease PerM
MKIEISIRTVLFTLALLASLWVVGQILDILFLLFIAFLLMTALHPLVIFLERFRVPRVLGILLIYTVVFGVFGASLVGAIPSLVTQSGTLVSQLPSFIARVLPYWNIDPAAISQQIQPIGESLVKVTLGIFSNIFAVVTVLVFTFYFLLERRHADEILTSIFGSQVAKQLVDVLRNIERRLGSWVRGQLLLMATIGVLSYIGLVILGIEFALPLAILAGLLELVPMVGPIISAIPAILVALAVSPFLALSVGALYIIVQQLENNILVPYIMRKSVGFPPLLTIVILMVGGRLAGIAGAILSVPIALVVQELISSVLFKNAERELKQATKNPSK